MLYYLRIILLTYLYCSASTALSQSLAYSDHIGSEDGLTSQLCQNLVEDNYGNLWIGSFGDVQKYNGHKVTSFPLYTLRDKELPVIDLIVDQSGMVWVLQGIKNAKHYSSHISLFHNYKISVIDPLTDIVTHINEYLESDKLEETSIKYIQIINEVIYFITYENLIYQYTDHLELYSDQSKLDVSILVNGNDEIIAYSDTEINTYSSDGNLIYSLDSTYLSKFPAFTISSKGEIIFIEQIDGSVDFFLQEKNQLTKLISIEENELFKFSKSNDLTNCRIDRLPHGKLKINQNYYASADSPSLILKNTMNQLPIFDYARSRSGLDFLATNLGVYVLKDDHSEFKNLAGAPETNSVRAFFINQDLRMYKRYNGEAIEQNSKKYDLNFLENQFIGHMASMHYQDPLDSAVIWSSGYLNQQKFRKIDFEKKELTRPNKLPAKTYNTNQILRSSITNKLYLSSNIGLLWLDEVSQEVKPVFNTEEASAEATHIIERENKLWIGSTSGIIVYDEKSNDYSIDPLFDSIDYTIQFIHQDLTDKTIVWLGTRQGGIIKWNTAEKSYEIYNTDKGLSNNDVHAIIEDSNERLWIPTNKNLNCLDKITGHNSIFTVQDGISNSEFNMYSYFFDKSNNIIYFGGLNGYTYFNPDSIATKELENNIELRVVEVNKTAEDHSLENIVHQVIRTNRIEILEEDVSLQLVLATNHLYHNNKSTYSYRIPGLYEEWITQTSNTINFNRLPYGSYTLELVSDLNKPSYTSKVLKLDIKVVQPFRKTMAANLIALLLFLCLIWLAVQRYNKNIKERNTKLEEIVSARTQELRALNTTKSKLFAILAHDLRNPIGSLNDITEKIKFLTRNNRLDEVEILAEQTKDKISALDENLNNILIWALSENKTLQQKPEKLSLKLEINKILNLYSTQITEKNISNSDNLDVVDQVYLDINILQTILRNVISNSLKFSAPSGKISFIKSYEDDDRIYLTISDEGIGMKKDSPHIDERQITKIYNEGKGSGIGLKIIYELAEISGVNIKVSTNQKSGTDFMLDMPRR